MVHRRRRQPTISPRVAVLVAVFVTVAAPIPIHGAETADDRRFSRARGGLWAGAGLLTGRLVLESDTAVIETLIDAQPATTIGGDIWADESTGFYAAGSIGIGADIDISSGGRSTAIRYRTHQFEAGARYRWFLGTRTDATGVFTGLGVRGIRQGVQDHRPSLLVSSTLIGPETHIGIELPLFSGMFWLRATGRAGLPFYVRESPADSGTSETFSSFGGRAELVVGLARPWSLQVLIDLAAQSVKFRGIGTRAAGVTRAETRDRFMTYVLVVRRAL